MTRSNARPIVPASSIAASMATKMTARLLARVGADAQPLMKPNTLVATKAPTAMNRLWPKLRTSIRPKTSVRPEAAMKMIMPIARPAMVSVSQVDDEPTSGQAASAIATINAGGLKSKARFGIGSAVAGTATVATVVMGLPPRSLVRGQREAEQAMLQRLVGGELVHRPAVDDSAVVH